MTEEPALLVPPSTGAVVRGAAPRLVRDAFGPLAAFFAGWKLVGLTAGIAMGAAFGVALFVYERSRGRPAVVVRLALLLVAIRASVGLSSGEATVYLAQEIGIDTLLGCAVLASLRSTRPFASWFAGDVFPLPREVLESELYARTMRAITLVWGVYFLIRALVRLAAVLTLSTDGYALVIALSDAPFLVALLAWSVYYSAGALRNDARWGPVIAAAQVAQRPAEPLSR